MDNHLLDEKYKKLDRIILKSPEKFSFQLTHWLFNNAEELGILALPLELDLLGTTAAKKEGNQIKVDFKSVSPLLKELAEQHLTDLRSRYSTDQLLSFPQTNLGSLNYLIDYQDRDKPIARGIYIGLGCPSNALDEKYAASRRGLLNAIAYQASSGFHEENPLGSGFALPLLRNLLVLQALKDEGCPLDAGGDGFAVLGIKDKDFLFYWDKVIGDTHYKSPEFYPSIRQDVTLYDSILIRVSKKSEKGVSKVQSAVFRAKTQDFAINFIVRDSSKDGRSSNKGAKKAPLIAHSTATNHLASLDLDKRVSKQLDTRIMQDIYWHKRFEYLMQQAGIDYSYANLDKAEKITALTLKPFAAGAGKQINNNEQLIRVGFTPSEKHLPISIQAIMERVSEGVAAWNELAESEQVISPCKLKLDPTPVLNPTLEQMNSGEVNFIIGERTENSWISLKPDSMGLDIYGKHKLLMTKAGLISTCQFLSAEVFTPKPPSKSKKIDDDANIEVTKPEVEPAAVGDLELRKCFQQLVAKQWVSNGTGFKYTNVANLLGLDNQPLIDFFKQEKRQFIYFQSRLHKSNDKSIDSNRKSNKAPNLFSLVLPFSLNINVEQDVVFTMGRPEIIADLDFNLKRNSSRSMAQHLEKYARRMEFNSSTSHLADLINKLPIEAFDLFDLAQKKSLDKILNESFYKADRDFLFEIKNDQVLRVWQQHPSVDRVSTKLEWLAQPTFPDFVREKLNDGSLSRVNGQSKVDSSHHRKGLPHYQVFFEDNNVHIARREIKPRGSSMATLLKRYSLLFDADKNYLADKTSLETIRKALPLLYASTAQDEAQIQTRNIIYKQTAKQNLFEMIYGLVVSNSGGG